MYTKLMSKLGYTFHDERFLSLALKHPSCGQENNQRLEFLGDAVLQLCISDTIYRRFTGIREGKMTAIRQKLVCEQALADIASGIGLGEELKMDHGFRDSGGQHQKGALSDAMEAVLAAVYLDGGFQSAKAVIDRLFVIGDEKEAETEDAKSMLQEWTQSRLGCVPVYRVDAEEGPAHDKTFTVSCLVDGKAVACAKGKRKQQAEQLAAGQALTILKAEREKNGNEAEKA